MGSEYTIQDSGKRQEFDTGSRRDTREGKGRFDLISPIFEERLAKHLEAGALKYGDRNWELGQPLGRYLDSALRHINKYRQGHREEDHLTAAAWNLQAFIHTEEQIRQGKLSADLDDNDYLGLPPLEEDAHAGVTRASSRPTCLCGIPLTYKRSIAAGKCIECRGDWQPDCWVGDKYPSGPDMEFGAIRQRQAEEGRL